MPGRRGFTLAEVLAVVAIMAILSAIATTAFFASRKAAQRAACISNMSQIGKALLMYAADADGLAPQIRTKSLLVGRERTPVHGDPKIWRDCLNRYVRNVDVFYCPSDSNARTTRMDGAVDGDENSLYTSYSTPIIVNGETFTDGSTRVSVDNPKFANVPYAQDRIPVRRDAKGQFYFRTFHGETATSLYYDGHVAHQAIARKSP